MWLGNQKRYFALKLPLAVDPEIITFAYVDPGHQTDKRVVLVGSRAWAALGGASQEGASRFGCSELRLKMPSVDRTARVLESMGGGGPRDKPMKG